MNKLIELFHKAFPKSSVESITKSLTAVTEKIDKLVYRLDVEIAKHKEEAIKHDLQADSKFAEKLKAKNIAKNIRSLVEGV